MESMKPWCMEPKQRRSEARAGNKSPPHTLPRTAGFTTAPDVPELPAARCRTALAPTTNHPLASAHTTYVYAPPCTHAHDRVCVTRIAAASRRMAANASTTEITPTGCAPHSRAERRPSVCDAASPTQCALAPRLHTSAIATVLRARPLRGPTSATRRLWFVQTPRNELPQLPGATTRLLFRVHRCLWST